MITCHHTGMYKEFEIDTDNMLQMVEDLDMDSVHETGVETLHRIFKS